MVYSWDQFKDVCFKLYIQERKPLEDIIKHLRETYNFTPSKRAYQTQFKRWGFPSKQNPAYRNEQLVKRVKELWEANYTQRDMLSTLNQEGFDIKERELMRLRAKNRWLLRIPNGMKQTATQEPQEADFQAQLLEAAGELPQTASTSPQAPAPEPQAVLSEDVLLKRKQRHDELQAESDKRWATRKRRRRTKSYAGLAADPPGPPRFPSETTLEESKQFLALDTKQYRSIRDQFQAICEDEGVVKKTLAGAEKWQAVKERLIRENELLQNTFWTDKTNVQSKELALDVICTDVTKRMRTMNRRMTLVDAKNVLGLNPEQSRQVRNKFYQMLQADHFTSKLETGQEHWQELKDAWLSETPLLQEILASGEDDPQHEEKKKALEILCRDVMKRLRDDHTQKKERSQADDPVESQNAISTAVAASDLVAPQPGVVSNPYQFSAQDISDLQIDPNLLEAAVNFSEPITTTPTAVYIRPHSRSTIHKADKMWLASMITRTVQELRGYLAAKWTDTEIVRIDGIEKDPTGQEISYLIEEDEELDAYLEHVQGRKAVFVVQLAPSNTQVSV